MTVIVHNLYFLLRNTGITEVAAGGCSKLCSSRLGCSQKRARRTRVRSRRCFWAHGDIDVYWQQKAWADPELTRKWLLNSMAKAIGSSVGEHLLLADNLAGQDVRRTAGDIGEKTAQTAASIGVRIWNLLASSA
jgi:hypothetical protein